MKKIISFVLLLSILFSFNQCASDSDSPDKDASDQQTPSRTQVEISPQVLEKVINAIPSPLEISSLIQQMGAIYAEEMLNSTSNADNYITNNEKAINLGIYGADLGYMHIYDKTANSLVYLETIKRLADDLKIGQFFDFQTLKRLVTHSKNVDSLLYISTSNLDKMNDHLRKQKRGDLSVLIVIGGWLEALHIATQVLRENYDENELLAERIGEQKITLDELLVLLNFYKSDPFFESLLTDFNDLKASFDQVTITYNYEEPTTKEEDGMLVVEDNSSTSIEISQENLNSITEKTQSIRNKLINS